MKKLLLNVTCVNDHFDQAPSHIVATLSLPEIERIKALSAMVRDNKLLSAKYLYGAGKYFHSDAIDQLVNDYGIAENEINEATLFDFQDDSTLMELKHIEVYNDNFKFKATPKHCGDGEICKSDKVMLTELENNNTYCALDY